MSKVPNDPERILLFGTGNVHKLSEVRGILGESWKVHSPEDLGLAVEFTETGSTLRENAIEKAGILHRMTGRNGFAEDSGLEVDALDGAPGVFTARYAGLQATAQANNRLLLGNLEGVSDRSARFRAVIALWWRDEPHIFEGVVEGRIAESLEGNSGFGYDPVFIPYGYDRPFAALDPSVKQKISHRAQAVFRMAHFLNRF